MFHEAQNKQMDQTYAILTGFKDIRDLKQRRRSGRRRRIVRQGKGRKIKTSALLDVRRERKQRRCSFLVKWLIFMSFKLFLLSHAHGILDDEELLILYEEYWPKNPTFAMRITKGFLLMI